MFSSSSSSSSPSLGSSPPGASAVAQPYLFEPRRRNNVDDMEADDMFNPPEEVSRS